MADETQNNDIDIDDWLDDIESETPTENTAANASSEEVSQADIDELLGGNSTAAAPTAPKSELNQTDIDSLLADDEPSETTGVDSNLDQSDIDSLLDGDQGDGAAASSAAPDDGSLAEIDIDNLLGDDDAGGQQAEGAPTKQAAPPAEEGMELDQDDMDKLFAEGDEGAAADPLSDKEVDFSEILGDDEGVEEALDLDAGALDATSLGLTGEGDEEKTVLAGAKGAGRSKGEKPRTDDGKAKSGLLPTLQKIAWSKAAARVAGGIFILLLLAGGYVLLGKYKAYKAKEPAIKTGLDQQIAETVSGAGTQEGQPPPVEPVNTLPVVKGDLYQMAGEGGELGIVLTGKDDDGDALTYEVVTPPKYGRLSGKPPELTYLPSNNFPGEDQFEFRCSDGKDFSQPAAVVITGPNLTQKAVAQKPPSAPKKMAVGARDITLKAESTEKIVIDWRKIWQQANEIPYSSKVKVELVDRNLTGSLTKASASEHLYVPEHFFSGTESIRYRFKYGGKQSATKTVTLEIATGNPAPELRIASGKDAYVVGETVVLDASPTRDDRRETVEFAWEQLAGVPVLLEARNQEGSVIAFVMPAAFSVEESPGPVFRVTAIDQTGKRDSREVKIGTISRRQTALWRGLPDGEIAAEPSCQKGGGCPGDLLPWAYQD